MGDRRARVTVLGFVLALGAMGVGASTSLAATPVTVSGHVLAQDSSPIVAAQLTFDIYTTTTLAGSAMTDGSGFYSVSIPTGTYDIMVAPPAGSNFGSSTVLGRSINADTTMNFILVAANADIVQGNMFDQLGHGLPGQNFALNGSGVYASSTTDSNGHFSVQVPPGTYNVQLNAGNTGSQLGWIYESLSASTQLTVNSSLTLPDFNFPFKMLQVHVRTPGGSGLANVYVHVDTTALSVSLGGLTFNGAYSAYGTTDANGEIPTRWMLPASYAVGAEPPQGSGFVSTSTSMLVTTDDSVTLVLTPALTVQGNMFDQLGHGLPGQNFALNGSGVYASSTTDSNGHFSVQVPPGTYNVQLNAGNSGSQLGWIYESLYATTQLTVNSSLTLPDFNFPFKMLGVHVQSAVGAGVSNAYVHIDTTALSVSLGGLTFGGSYSAYGTTDANGDIPTRWMLPGSYSLGAIPSAGSPYAQFSFGVVISADLNEVIVLQYAHQQPVTVVALSPTPYSAGIFSGPATVTLSATAASGYTVASTSYSIDGGTLQTYSAPYSVTGQGNHVVTYYSTDNSGVVENTKTLSIQIDSTPPVITPTVSPAPNGAGWNNRPVTVSWAVSDPESGISSSSGCASTTVSSDTAGNTLTCSAINGAGIANSASVWIKLDQVAPTTTASMSTSQGAYTGTWTKLPVTVTLACQDNAGGSGCVSTQFSFDGVAWFAYTGPFAVTVEGQSTVSYRSSDAAGNVETAKTVSIKIDKTPPVTTFTARPGNLNGRTLTTANATVTVSPGNISLTATCFNTFSLVAAFAATDNASGVAQIKYGLAPILWGQPLPNPALTNTINGPSGTVTFSQTGAYVLTFAAVDQAGNQEATQMRWIVVDATHGFVCATTTINLAALPASGTVTVTGSIVINGKTTPFTFSFSYPSKSM